MSYRQRYGKVLINKVLWERLYMMSDLKGEGGSKMTPKNRTLGGRMVSNDLKQIRYHLWIFPKTVGTLKNLKSDFKLYDFAFQIRY